MLHSNKVNVSHLHCKFIYPISFSYLMASVLTIILNWNCAKDTIEAIDSVMASEVEPHGVDIFLVDNGSGDNSVEILRKYFVEKSYKVVEIKKLEDVEVKAKGTKQIFFYISPKNLGFTGGNNLGFKFALKHNYDFVFLLNADAVVNIDTIKVLVESFKDEKIACVGPKVYAYDYNGRKDYISFAGAEIDLRTCKVKVRNGFDIGQYNTSFETSYVEGSAMMILVEALQKVGFFDERFFAYWEESDWCTRAKKSGYKILYIPNTWVKHKGVTPTFFSMRAYTFHMLIRNKVLFAKKHCKNWFVFCIVNLFYYPFRLFIYIFRRKDLLVATRTIKEYYTSFIKGLFVP